jgi:hypothetical protein
MFYISKSSIIEAKNKNKQIQIYTHDQSAVGYLESYKIETTTTVVYDFFTKFLGERAKVPKSEISHWGGEDRRNGVGDGGGLDSFFECKLVKLTHTVKNEFGIVCEAYEFDKVQGTLVGEVLTDEQYAKIEGFEMPSEPSEFPVILQFEELETSGNYVIRNREKVWRDFYFTPTFPKSDSIIFTPFNKYLDGMKIYHPKGMVLEKDER